MKNKITNTFSKIEKLPNVFQKVIKKKAIAFFVPFIGTAGIEFEKTTSDIWVATIKNRRKVQNHLKQVHAAGMILLAETVAVFITSINLQENKIPLVKRIEADFVKRSFGNIKATAKLTDEQIAIMQNLEKGETVIEVILIDQNNIEPVIIKVTSAWITKS